MEHVFVETNIELEYFFYNLILTAEFFCQKKILKAERGFS